MAHPRPTGGHATRLVLVGRSRRLRRLDRDLRLHTDLETAQPCSERLTEPGVGVEHESVVGVAGDLGERVDFAGGVEHERPARLADGERSDVLRDLRLQVRLGIGALDDDLVASGGIEERCGKRHVPSLAWHTAIVMTNDDTSRNGRVRDLAERTVDSLLLLVQRGTRLAFGTLVIVTIVCAGGVALGIAALSDGMETVWAIFGGFAALVAIGAVGLAMFRLWAILRLSGALVTELERLILADPRSERVVIETIEAADDVQDQSAVVMSRQFFNMNDTVGTAGQFTALAFALKSVTTFPLLILLGTVITIGFAGLSMLFLLGLLL